MKDHNHSSIRRAPAFPALLLRNIASRARAFPIYSFFSLSSTRLPFIFLASLLFIFLDASSSDAYIGPGAGFALATSFLALFTTIMVVLGVLALLPLRLLTHAFRRAARGARTRDTGRAIVVGLDGLDPRIARELMGAGRMPNFTAVAVKGHFGPLNTTCPPISPVAWSTFATGANPGRHNIFDFLAWDRAAYLPKLSSSEISGAARFIRVGPIAIPLSRPRMKLLRKGKPFWDVAAEHGEAAVVIRVPITFPAEKSRALLLSGMCVPDLRGSQGTYSFYTSKSRGCGKATTGGERFGFTECKGVLSSELVGPENPLAKKHPPLTVPFTLRPDAQNNAATLRIKGAPPVRLEKGKYSEWIPLTFKASATMRISGIAKFLLKETSPHVELYVTPINIDPTRPALPVSRPTIFSIYLGKLLGRFATLGLAEDTWALNHSDISPSEYLAQVWDNHAEREKMLNLSLDKIRSGLIVCVFDTPDRVQHMFYREHAAAGDGKDPLTQMYLRMDELLGRIMKRIGPDDTLMVISDHGVRGFVRCFNVNTWLLLNGYLALKPDADPDADYYQSVDWARTRAFGLGLAGLYLNTKGKGARGTVEPGAEVEQLKKEISEKLRATIDPKTNRCPLMEIRDTAKIYDGPFTENAPDLILCYDDGYRTSWESVTGKLTKDVFTDNDRPWSGDHCADPRLVPGSLLSNRPVTLEKPHIRDISATVLSLFGIKQPENMQGRSIFEKM